jgi:hypothetical protein
VSTPINIQGIIFLVLLVSNEKSTAACPTSKATARITANQLELEIAKKAIA